MPEILNSKCSPPICKTLVWCLVPMRGLVKVVVFVLLIEYQFSVPLLA